MISLPRQKQVFGDRYELGEIALLFSVHPNGRPLVLHCDNLLPVPDEPDITLWRSFADRNADRLQIVLHGELSDLAAHGCADLARGAVMHAIVDPRIDDLSNVF